MKRIAIRRPNARSLVLLAAVGLATAAPASAQPAGPDSLAAAHRHDAPVAGMTIPAPADSSADHLATTTAAWLRLAGAPDGYDFILAWVRAMASNPDSVLGAPSGRRDSSATAASAPTAGADRPIDADELELIGARTQALNALQELLQRHRDPVPVRPATETR